MRDDGASLDSRPSYQPRANRTGRSWNDYGGEQGSTTGYDSYGRPISSLDRQSNGESGWGGAGELVRGLWSGSASRTGLSQDGYGGQPGEGPRLEEKLGKYTERTSEPLKVWPYRI